MINQETWKKDHNIIYYIYIDNLTTITFSQLTSDGCATKFSRPADGTLAVEISQEIHTDAVIQAYGRHSGTLVYVDVAVATFPARFADDILQRKMYFD